MAETNYNPLGTSSDYGCPMNEYGIWNVIAVVIAAAAFIGTQLTARRNERANFLLERVGILTRDNETLSEQVRDKTKEIERLEKRNVLLIQKLAGIENGDND